MIDFKEPEILKFTQNVANFFSESIKKSEYTDLDNFPLNSKQALYILNWTIPAVTYTKGINNLLGYSNDEFDLEKVLTSIHPEDMDLANRITKATVAHCSRQRNDVNSYLNITYRLQKKDGTYIKVLRQSGLYLSDKDGRLVANYSLLTDITFMNHGHSVDWEIEAIALDKDMFHKKIYEAFNNLFTCREKEIIQLIKEGQTTSQISESLFISPHTVGTHRKNIMRKSNCSCTKSLIDFCQKNGIL